MTSRFEHDPRSCKLKLSRWGSLCGARTESSALEVGFADMKLQQDSHSTICGLRLLLEEQLWLQSRLGSSASHNESRRNGLLDVVSLFASGCCWRNVSDRCCSRQISVLQNRDFPFTVAGLMAIGECLSLKYLVLSIIRVCGMFIWSQPALCRYFGAGSS